MSKNVNIIILFYIFLSREKTIRILSDETKHKTDKYYISKRNLSQALRI